MGFRPPVGVILDLPDEANATGSDFFRPERRLRGGRRRRLSTTCTRHETSAEAPVMSGLHAPVSIRDRSRARSSSRASSRASSRSPSRGDRLAAGAAREPVVGV